MNEKMSRGKYIHQITDFNTNSDLERRVQYVEKHLEEKPTNTIRLDTIVINNTNNQIEFSADNDNKRNNVFCPKYNEYKSYLHKLQHGGFPLKDYAHINRVRTNLNAHNFAPVATSSINSVSAANMPTAGGVNTFGNSEKRVINIKTTVLQPFSPHHQYAVTGMSRFPNMKPNIYHPNNLMPTKFNLNLVLVNK